MPSMTIGLILAGGRSSRLDGVDKTFIPLSGRPLLVHVMGRLAPQVDMLAISSNRPPSYFASFGLPVIPDVLEGVNGPLAGVYAGLTTWPDSELVTVAVDLPFLPRDLVRKLKQGGQGAACTFATDGARHALAVWWTPNIALKLRSYLESGDHSLKHWLDRYGQPVAFPTGNDADVAFNINTPGDLVIAEDRILTLQVPV